jgi:hypothetical protein
MKSLANPYAFFMSSRAHYEIEVQMKSSPRAEVGLETRLYQPEALPDIPAATDVHPEREISVVFTDHAGTLAAVGMADQLTKKLDARLRLLMLFEVPYTTPLTGPAVPVGLLEVRLRAWASKIPIDIAGAANRKNLCEKGVLT